MQTLEIDLPGRALAEFCGRWKIRELAVFGSAVRDDFRADSDVDFLVTFDRDARWSLWDVIAAEQELTELVGRPVDLVERTVVEQSENWIRKNSILAAWAEMKRAPKAGRIPKYWEGHAAARCLEVLRAYFSIG